MTESKFLCGLLSSECAGIPLREVAHPRKIIKELPRKTPQCKHRRCFSFFSVVREVGSPERTPSLMMKHLIRCLTRTQHANIKPRQ